MKQLKELITSLLEGILLLIVFLFIIGGTATGALIANSNHQINIFLGAGGGFLAGAVLTALVAGPLVLLMEIRDATKATAEGTHKK